MSVLAALTALPDSAVGGGGGGSKSPTIQLVVGLFFALVGGVQAANPRLLWRMNKWQYKNPEANEPSEKGFLAQRVFGALFLVLGLVLAVIALFRF